MQERIEDLRESVAGISQWLEAPKTWIGSSGVNVLQVLCELLDLVEQMNTAIATHKHGATPIPDNAGGFTINSATALGLANKVKPITG